MSTSARRWVLALVATGAACGTSSAARQNGAAVPSRPSAAATPPPEEPNYAGSIDRAGLVSLIERGLGYLLSFIELSSEAQSGQFEGFRVVRIHPAWAEVGLLAGDLIQRVNGQAIERPEQAQAVYESLKTASELRVRFLRAGEPAELRLLID